jgi:outer membrane immunogenic protein
MKYTTLSGIAVSAICIAAPLGVAGAADLPYKAPPPVIEYGWTGCYVGGNAGWAYEYNNGYNTTGATTFIAAGGGVVATPGAVGPLTTSTNSNGVIGGGQVGCNYQWGHWVVGVEGDLEAMGHQGTTLNSGNAALLGVGVNADHGVRYTDQWESSARLRLGFTPWDRTLLYVTGGAAWMRIASQQLHLTGPVSAGIWQTDTALGWTVGAGWEYAATKNWIIRAEYLYTAIPAYTTFTPGVGIPGGIGDVTNLSTYQYKSEARLGISYKFDWYTAPVYTKY